MPPAASPGLGDILVPGRKKRKRRFDGYQPGLIGFDDHDDGTSGPADPNSDLPTKKRARHSIGGAKPIPATAKNKGIRGLVFARKAKHNVIGKEAPCTGLKLSEKENKAKGLRKNKVAPGKLSIFYLKEPEKHDTVIPRTDIDDIFRTVTSDNNADEATMDTDVDMGANLHTHTHGRFPTPIQHAQTPRPPSLAKEGSVASHGPSQRAETTQEVIDVLDYELNLFWDEGEDADLQRPLQLNCEVHSSSTRPTVCAPSVIEVDDTIDFGPIPSTSTGVPYSDTAGASGSWQFHDLAPNPEVPFIRDDLYEPSLNVSGACEANKKSEERIPDPFASHVVDLHRQTIQEQLRVWADNPQADISFDLANELVVVRENLAVRVAKQRFADDISGVSRPHEKGDIERFIELNLKAIPSEPEGISDERDVIPESPEVERQSTPEERAAVMSLSGVSGSGSSRLSTTPGALSIINLDIKARNEGAAAAPLFAAKPKLQEPTLPSKSAPSGTYLSTTESKSAHQEPAAPLKRVGATSRTTRTQSSRKVTEPALEDLNNIMLKRLNLTLDALAQRKRPTWDVSVPSTCTSWVLTKVHCSPSLLFALKHYASGLRNLCNCNSNRSLRPTGSKMMNHDFSTYTTSQAYRSRPLLLRILLYRRFCSRFIARMYYDFDPRMSCNAYYISSV